MTSPEQAYTNALMGQKQRGIFPSWKRAQPTPLSVVIFHTPQFAHVSLYKAIYLLGNLSKGEGAPPWTWACKPLVTDQAPRLGNSFHCLFNLSDTTRKKKKKNFLKHSEVEVNSGGNWSVICGNVVHLGKLHRQARLWTLCTTLLICVFVPHCQWRIATACALAQLTKHWAFPTANYKTPDLFYVCQTLQKGTEAWILTRTFTDMQNNPLTQIPVIHTRPPVFH